MSQAFLSMSLKTFNFNLMDMCVYFLIVTFFLLYMGDSREVPHVNIVRKLRHSCEDDNFTSSIYYNTLKQFNFIVDYCLSLHIIHKHSQTHSEHFL